MSIVEVKVPQLSESVAEATMLQWKKKVGDAVTVDEILIEIETDKVVLEVPAPSSGVLTQILQIDGATVVAEQLIAKIDTAAVAGAVTAPASPAAGPSPASGAPAALAPQAPVGGSQSAAGFAMPAAQKILADNNLQASSIAGTGRDGRITKGDALQAAQAPKFAPAVQVASTASAPLPQVIAPRVDLGERPEQRVPMSRLRARVAERLIQSQATNAILTTFNEINMAPVMEMRKRFQE